MSFSAGGGRGRVSADINMTPLVDVVLVLLIIFMVMTPIMLKELDVEVPEKADVAVVQPVTTEQLVLKVSADGALALNHEPVAKDALQERLTSVLSGRREKLLFFDIDDEANYGNTIEIMDIARGSGVKVLGLMTKSAN